MVDSLAPEERSARMSKIHGKNTEPELTVRRLLNRMGYRFRLHRRDLPGSPDIVLPRYKKVIFVHGCFWHGHRCKAGRLPKSNTEFWAAKIQSNRVRDGQTIRSLRRMGWSVAILWQCQIGGSAALESRLRSFLALSHSSLKSGN